ncbi:MAG: hypothetical protein IPK58_04470 [Acidobacteria bacterium]|nr:hypothetical protein [Acidobacteriota bacterium]
MFTYDDYNNQTSVKEYDYGSSNPTLLRTTEIEYETGSGWIANKVSSLPRRSKRSSAETPFQKRFTNTITAAMIRPSRQNRHRHEHA